MEVTTGESTETMVVINSDGLVVMVLKPVQELVITQLIQEHLGEESTLTGKTCHGILGHLRTATQDHSKARKVGTDGMDRGSRVETTAPGFSIQTIQVEY